MNVFKKNKGLSILVKVLRNYCNKNRSSSEKDGVTSTSPTTPPHSPSPLTLSLTSSSSSSSSPPSSFSEDEFIHEVLHLMQRCFSYDKWNKNEMTRVLALVLCKLMEKQVACDQCVKSLVDIFCAVTSDGMFIIIIIKLLLLLLLLTILIILIITIL